MLSYEDLPTDYQGTLRHEPEFLRIKYRSPRLWLLRISVDHRYCPGPFRDTRASDVRQNGNPLLARSDPLTAPE